MLHDIVISLGVYSLLQIEVTPATVIAFLTILGFSLYDTVVVFDKVRENTPKVSVAGRMTYTEMANLSMNQVLMRSINTSLTALLPVLSILVVGRLDHGRRHAGGVRPRPAGRSPRRCLLVDLHRHARSWPG